MQFERRQPAGNRPVSKRIGRLACYKRRGTNATLHKALRARLKHINGQARIVVRIKIVAANKMLGIGHVIHNGVEVMHVVAHINFDEQPIRVKRHE